MEYTLFVDLCKLRHCHVNNDIGQFQFVVAVAIAVAVVVVVVVPATFINTMRLL